MLFVTLLTIVATGGHPPKISINPHLVTHRKAGQALSARIGLILSLLSGFNGCADFIYHLLQ
jgi:hypothetical protein